MRIDCKDWLNKYFKLITAVINKQPSSNQNYGCLRLRVVHVCLESINFTETAGTYSLLNTHRNITSYSGTLW